MPKRIQLKRSKGWRMPPGTKKVDRSTRWGNPFKVGFWLGDIKAIYVVKSGLGHLPEDTVLDQKMVVDFFRLHAKWSIIGGEYPFNKIELLRGKNLACWCKPGEPCHADVLLELANVVGERLRKGRGE